MTQETKGLEPDLKEEDFWDKKEHTQTTTISTFNWEKLKEYIRQTASQARTEALKEALEVLNRLDTQEGEARYVAKPGSKQRNWHNGAIAVLTQSREAIEKLLITKEK